MMRIPARSAPNGPMSGTARQGTGAPGSFTGGANAGTPKHGTGNALGMRDRLAGMLARGTPYNAAGGQRPFDAFMNGRAGPGEGQSRADWFAANPNMQRQWQAYRRQNAGGIADWRASHPQTGAPVGDGRRLGLGGRDAQWWKDVGYTPHFISQLPGLLDHAMMMNRGGMDPATVDWNDPRSIRRAAAFLPMDTSQFSNGGRPMGMNYNADLWRGWSPGDPSGRGVTMLPFIEGVAQGLGG